MAKGLEHFYDLCVVGGGCAGISAALSAAELGVRTLLIERAEVLGGNASGALVHTICGLYFGDRSEPEFANSGFPRRFSERLVEQSAAAAAEKVGRVWVLPTYPHRMARVVGELCDQTPSLARWMSSEVVAARSDDDGFEIVCRDENGTRAVRSSLAIDTSGDASLAHLLDVECSMEPASLLQNPSFIFRVRGVDPAETEGFSRMRISHRVARAVIDEKLPVGVGSILLRPGPGLGEAYVTLNINRCTLEAYSPLDASAVTRVGRRARADASALVDFLRTSHPGFADCEVVEWPRRIGVRESRRVVGEVVMDAHDVLGGKQRDDEVCRSTWPVEIWDDHNGARFSYPDGPCSISLESLICRTNPRLGIAGRCMSATHEALGALRVIGTALATGEAIGKAAALAVERATTLRGVSAAAVREVGLPTG